MVRQGLAERETILEDIARICGANVAERVRLHCGGQRIYIPSAKKLTSENRIVELLGMEHARKLADGVASSQIGIHVDIPLGKPEYHKREVLRRSLAGESANDIARALGLCRRTIFNIRQRLRDKGHLKCK
ncbi:MAG: helix-turn-helix domain-containing protein [Pseudomonadota bacterium]